MQIHYFYSCYINTIRPDVVFFNTGTRKGGGVKNYKMNHWVNSSSLVIQRSAENLMNLENPKSMKGNRRPKFSEGPPKIYRTGHNLKVSQSRSRLIKWKKSV